MKKSPVFFLLCFCSTFLLQAQEARQLSMSDAILKSRTSLAPVRLKQLQWIPGADVFSHVVDDRIVRVTVPKLDTDTLDILSYLNSGLATFDEEPLERLPTFTWVEDAVIRFRTKKGEYTWSASTGMEQLMQLPEDAANLDIHEDAHHAAYTSGDKLMVSAGGKEKLVAQSEEDGVVYGQSVHRNEFGITKGTFWSTSGDKLAFYRMDERMVTPYSVYVLDSMPAQNRNIRYPFAGAKSHHVTVGVYDVKSGKTIYLKTGEPKEQYLTNVAWTPDDKHILIAVVNREQDHCWLNMYDAENGKFEKTLFEETDERWVEPEHPALFVPGRDDEFIWQSERSGYNHLYRYNLKGQLLQEVSAGEAPVTRVIGFDEDGEGIFYEMADMSGLERHAFYSTLDASGMVIRLFDLSGMHSVTPSADGNWVLSEFTSLTTPRTVMVSRTGHSEDGLVYYSAPDPLEDYDLGETRLLTIAAADGTPLNARVILPPNFDPKQKYPAIVYVYNGPHVQLVTNSWLGQAQLWMHRMAQQGYIMFTIDGRGSAHRGFDFESAIHRQLGTLEVADQLAGVDFMKSQPVVDTSRIGVFGWSYGGFMTTSLMSRPEAAGTFKCAVAGGPVIDWRMYEIMYTERYMDSPQENPEGYEANSLFNHIDNLQGRLLMIHGALDDVVLWQHSLRYVRECVRKGKQLDYFVYPGHPHNVRGKDRVHLFEKIEQFFVENL